MDLFGIREKRVRKENQALITKLRSVFNYYKDYYNLPITLSIKHFGNSCYFHDIYHKINISFSDVFRFSAIFESKERFNHNSFEELAICVLLHELKHAIDFYKDHMTFQKMALYNMMYNSSIKYREYYKYSDLPLEHRADIFAIIEKSKWIY
jgi:hypothetical protein